MKKNDKKGGEPLIILLVEDNAGHAEMVMRNLEEHRIANTIKHVRDGEAALDYLYQREDYQDKKKYPRPHLILLDLRLPKIDGLEVLAEAKESEALRDIPIVVLTSSEAEKDVVSAYNSYVNSYLVKPIDFDKFHKMINDMGYYWLAWNHQRERA